MPAPWKKTYNKPGQYIRKQAHHFADKGPYSQSYYWFYQLLLVLPVVTYGCESWTVKKAEHGRIDAFQLWY